MRSPYIRNPGLIILAILCFSSASWAECSLGVIAALPLRSVGDRFAITASINGHASDLILDTGGFRTAIDTSAAARLGLEKHLSSSQTYGIGGSQQIYRAQATSMQIGLIRADGANLAVEDIGDLDKNASLDGMFGMFGMSMMSHYDIDLNFAGHEAVLYKADGDCDKPHVTLGPTLYDVPLEDIRRDQQAVVTMIVDGHRLRALLSSAASKTVMYRRAAMRLGLDLSGLHDSQHLTVQGVGNLVVPAFKHVFKTVEIGDLQIQNMPILIVSQRDNGIDQHHLGSLLENEAGDDVGAEDMMLGADFMRMVHLWISHSSHTLIMQYPPKASPPLPQN